MVRTDSLTRTLSLTLALTGLAAVVFTFHPEIDLRFSSLFYNDSDGFWLARFEIVDVLRRAFWAITVLAGLGTLGLLVIALLRPDWCRLHPRVPLYALSCFALCPGLLANGLLKEYWGRARPRNVTDYGGDLTFSSALQFSDQCAQNCSFVSGEASGIATLCALCVLLVVPSLDENRRRVAVGSLLALGGLAGMLRIVVGGHYLSDVVFAVLFAVLIAAGLYRIFGIDRTGVLRDTADERSGAGPLQELAQVGRRLRSAWMSQRLRR